ncbi:hypothetical protein BvCmsHHP056_01353 [Escherichia coli]|nr:hypothetical protein BvCmsHHP056_01353 [Escherichia coli]
MLFHWNSYLVQMKQYMMKGSGTKIEEQDYEAMLPLTQVNLHLISDEFLSLRMQKTLLISEYVDLQMPPDYIQDAWLFLGIFLQTHPHVF